MTPVWAKRYHPGLASPGDLFYDAVMHRLPEAIRSEAPCLFEDVRLEDIDLVRHAAFVIARVLDRGTLRSVAALVRFYGRERVKKFFLEGGARQVSRRTVPLWAAYLGVSGSDCTSGSSRRPSSSFWPD